MTLTIYHVIEDGAWTDLIAHDAIQGHPDTDGRSLTYHPVGTLAATATPDPHIISGSDGHRSLAAHLVYAVPAWITAHRRVCGLTRWLPQSIGGSTAR